jgi:energy-converting hydrogenase Eha subunit C
MSRSSVLIAIGILTALVAFAGVPLVWLRILLPFFGVILVVIGFLMRLEYVARAKRDLPTPSEPHEISPIA